MGQVIQLPSRAATNRTFERLHTLGAQWTTQERKMLDRIEFLEAMILVLDDVRMQNIRDRDYAMMEIITEESALYSVRLNEALSALAELRREFRQSQPALAHS